MGTGAKYCTTGILDGFFSGLYSTAGGNLRIVVLESSAVVPTLASVSSNSTGFLAYTSVNITTGNFVVSNDTSGRKVTIAAYSSAAILRDGNACVVAIVEDASGPRYVTTVTTQALVTGGKVNIGSWVISIDQPSL